MQIALKSWIDGQLTHFQDRPLFVGINAPQGAGKTTACQGLVKSFFTQGKKVLTLSIDDFYLTHAAQCELAGSHADNPYWQARGYPGTHDIELGVETLEALRRKNPVNLPRYDKSAWRGMGDRLPTREFSAVDGKVDIVLLEGWMLGFPTVEESVLEDSHLKLINHALGQYQAWLEYLNLFVHVQAEQPEWIVEWRVQAEDAARNRGKSAMSEGDVLRYAQSFLPAYRTYVPALRKMPPVTQDRVLHLTLDRHRRVISRSSERC